MIYKPEPMNVVIADDSTLVRDRLERQVADIPNINIVGCAGNSSETIQLVKQKKPDAVILDIRMPGESGIEVLKKIKKYNPQTVVIILTNYPSSQYKAMCYRLGVDYFFDKSMEYQLITNVLVELSRGHFYYIYEPSLKSSI
jgi:DNA-binding NarL/FixJ family response regulator